MDAADIEFVGEPQLQRNEQMDSDTVRSPQHDQRERESIHEPIEGAVAAANVQVDDIESMELEVNGIVYTHQLPYQRGHDYIEYNEDGGAEHENDDNE